MRMIFIPSKIDQDFCFQSSVLQITRNRKWGHKAFPFVVDLYACGERSGRPCKRGDKCFSFNKRPNTFSSAKSYFVFTGAWKTQSVFAIRAAWNTFVPTGATFSMRSNAFMVVKCSTARKKPFDAFLGRGWGVSEITANLEPFIFFLGYWEVLSRIRNLTCVAGFWSTFFLARSVLFLDLFVFPKSMKPRKS